MPKAVDVAHVIFEATDLGRMEAFMQDFGAQMFQMQMDMIAIRPDTTTFADFHGHGAGDNVAARQILRRRRVAFHETLTA